MCSNVYDLGDSVPDVIILKPPFWIDKLSIVLLSKDFKDSMLSNKFIRQFACQKNVQFILLFHF